TQIAANTAYYRNENSFPPGFVQTVPDLERLQLLTNADESEVLEFLAKSPVHTVVMTSFIRDNGLESADNRGKYYGYRSTKGTLEGVALIGHTTIIESRSTDSLQAFAIIARTSETPIHVMMSSGNTTETFWKYFTGDASQPRLVCEEMLFELNFPFLVQECQWDVRLAKAEELEQVAEAHAEVAFAESGINPLVRDREGFLKRALKRIEKERTFVVFEDGKLLFKADIVCEADDVYYLEGIYVAPEMRGKGIGASCLAKLSLELLSRKQHICMLTNIDFKSAHRSFEKAGYKNTNTCTTIFI
ncbi:MAG: GNAT family N-acetyltransferase, partial [Acidobacteriota bacterium]